MNLRQRLEQLESRTPKPGDTTRAEIDAIAALITRSATDPDARELIDRMEAAYLASVQNGEPPR